MQEVALAKHPEIVGGRQVDLHEGQESARHLKFLKLSRYKQCISYFNYTGAFHLILFLAKFSEITLYVDGEIQRDV